MATRPASDAEKRLGSAYQAVLFVAGMSIVIGLIAVLFDVRFLKQFGHGVTSLLSGAVFLILSQYIKRRSLPALAIAISLYVIDGAAFLYYMPRMDTPPVGGMILRVFLIVLMFRGISAIRELRFVTESPASTEPIYDRRSVPAGSHVTFEPRMGAGAPGTVTSAANPPESAFRLPQALSFVAPGTNPPAVNGVQPESVDAPAGTVRFSAYRCEIDSEGLRSLYLNASQQVLDWKRVVSIVVRQLPVHSPWDGKLMMDLISSDSGSDPPVRILSTTFVNYAFLPAGQTASSRENMRRLVEYICERNTRVHLEPGTVAFVRAGRQPIRFVNMTQFAQYDSRFHS